jgi:hypothetical protein
MNRKIKVFFIMFAIIGFIILQVGNRTTVAKEELDLLKLASVLQSENILLDEWSLNAREHLVNLKTQKEIQAYTNDLRQKFPDWKWSTPSTSRQKWEITAVSPSHQNRKESLQLMATLTKQKADAYIIYRVTGTALNSSTESFFTGGKFEARLSDIFREKPAIFSCIKGVYGDKMVKALPNKVNNVLSAFNAKEVEALKEDSFMSVTGFSPMFANSIDGKNGSFNLQVAVRSEGLGAKKTIVIGTPIITVEY